MVGPRASHSSSHCNEQWEGCRFDMARSETLCGLTPASQLEMFNQSQLVVYSSSFLFCRLPHFIVYLVFALAAATSVDVAASYKLTVAASAKLSCPRFELSPLVFWESVPCIRRHASAGHLVVSDGWRSPVPQGDNTGRGEFFYLFSQPSHVGPADSSRTSRWLVVWTVYEMAGAARSDGCSFPCVSVVRRCGVIAASCCGSGGPNLSRR